MGRAIIDWVNTSGVGVISAPSTKDRKMTSRKCLPRKSEPTSPILPRIVMTRGNSNTKPIWCVVRSDGNNCSLRQVHNTPK